MGHVTNFPRQHPVAVAAVAMPMVLLLVSPLWLPMPGRFLMNDDRIAPADAIVVLGGDLFVRANAGAVLFGQGYAPKVVVLGTFNGDDVLRLAGVETTEAELAARLLERSKVPRHAIIMLKVGSGTWEEAEYIRGYARAQSLRSVIVVTSQGHTRRARWVFRRALEADGIQLMFVEADNGVYSAEDWWRSEQGLVSVFSEYVKIGYYVLKYSFRDPLPANARPDVPD
jgi:uncharacterized SAM-binding protein YcdF (DUF218 family)